jgi:hypothetical protein
VAASDPALRILAMTPLTLAGEHFTSGERVRVDVASDGEPAAATVCADGAGTFRVVFACVRTGRSVAELCVRATGDRGSSVAFALNQPQRGDLRV